MEFRSAKTLGVIGEVALQRREIIISTKNPTSEKYQLNSNSDLTYIPGYALLTFPIIENEDIKVQTPKGPLWGVVQIQMSETNYSFFKSIITFKDVLLQLFEAFAIRLG